MRRCLLEVHAILLACEQALVIGAGKARMELETSLAGKGELGDRFEAPLTCSLYLPALNLHVSMPHVNKMAGFQGLIKKGKARISELEAIIRMEGERVKNSPGIWH